MSDSATIIGLGTLLVVLFIAFQRLGQQNAEPLDTDESQPIPSDYASVDEFPVFEDYAEQRRFMAAVRKLGHQLRWQQELALVDTQSPALERLPGSWSRQYVGAIASYVVESRPFTDKKTNSLFVSNVFTRAFGFHCGEDFAAQFLSDLLVRQDIEITAFEAAKRDAERWLVSQHKSGENPHEWLVHLLGVGEADTLQRAIG